MLNKYSRRVAASRRIRVASRASRWSDQRVGGRTKLIYLISIRNIALKGINKALEGQFWHQKQPSKKLDCKIFKGHQKWRAQTGITFREIVWSDPKPKVNQLQNDIFFGHLVRVDQVLSPDLFLGPQHE